MALPEIFLDTLPAGFENCPLAEGVSLDGGLEFKAHFNSPYQMADLLAAKYESQMPTCFCQASDVASAQHGSILSVRGLSYRVIGIEPTNAATTTLVLSQDLAVS